MVRWLSLVYYNIEGKESERMEVSVMKVKPFRGKFVGRKKANRVNDMFLSASRPDRTALKKESEEFLAYIREKRSIQKV